MDAGTQGMMIFFGIFGGIIAFAVIYNLISKSKGSLNIITDKQVYQGGETISGKLSVLPRKPIHCRKLSITLRCEIRSQSGKNSSTRVVYAVEEQLVVDRNFNPRMTQEYPFNLILPETIPYESFNFGAALGPTATALTHLAQHTQRMNTHWTLYAHLDAEGVDLQNSKRVQVNFAPDAALNPAAAQAIAPAISKAVKWGMAIFLLFFIGPPIVVAIVALFLKQPH